MKNALIAVWRFLASIGIWIWLNVRGYKTWSAIHRAIFDRKYRTTELATYATLTDLAAWIAKQEWVKDGLDSLYDAVCSPQKVQAVGQTGDHKIGDCDEFAIYQTAVIEKSLAMGLMKTDNVQNPRFFTVTWMEKSGKNSGHNVCLLERPQPNGPVKFSYMDYGMPSEPPLDTPAQVAVLIASRYSGWDSVGSGKVESGVLCWCACKTNMSPVASGIGSGWTRGVSQP